jgi:hypothetical protein
MRNLRRLPTVTAALAILLVSPGGSQSFGGRAAAVQVRVAATGSTVTLADSGPLPASGGGVASALLSAKIPGSQTAGVVSLAAGTLQAAAVGAGGTDALASVADVELEISGNGIIVGFLMARSTAACGPDLELGGSSQLAKLVINGQPAAITGTANQIIVLPNGRAIINEQRRTAAGNSGGISVNALHVTTRDSLTGLELADVVLAQADARIECNEATALAPESASAEPALGFTSGGGWIPPPNDDVFGKGTFGFFGAFEADTFRGQLVYIDHGAADFTLQSTAISFFSAGCSSTMSGSAETNRGTVTFSANFVDNGEPGRQDTFSIDAHSDDTGYGYSRVGVLAGGNIQADGSFAGGKVLAHNRTCG